MPWDDCLKEGGKKVATLDCVPIVVKNVIDAAFVFAGIIAVILLIYFGIRLVISSGDPKQVEGARKIMTYTIVGFLIILLSYTILKLIANVTGVECILNFGFTTCQ